jgi:hypothetical protein
MCVCVCVCVCVITTVWSRICAYRRKYRVQLWLNLKVHVFIAYYKFSVFPRTETVVCQNYLTFLQFQSCMPNDTRNFSGSCTIRRSFFTDFRKYYMPIFFVTEKFWLTCKPFELGSRLSALRPGFYPRLDHVGYLVDKLKLGWVPVRVLLCSPVSVISSVRHTPT